MQVTTGNDSFDLIAVNDKMQVVWRTTLAGYGIKTDKLKGKVIALASSDHSNFKGTNNTFVAYVLDSSNGKVLATKTVYKSSNEYIEYPQMYTGDGSFFKLAVRQTAYKRKLHLAGPSMSVFTTGDYFRNELNDTRSLKVVEFNDNLDSVKAFSPVISTGKFISLAWNKSADMFISWLNGPSIEIYKYDADKTAPSNQLTVPVIFKERADAILSDYFYLLPAENRDELYYGITYSNQNKDPELGIGKLNFATSKKTYVVQILDRNNLKTLKKAFVPVTKDIDDIDFGDIRLMEVKFMSETSGRLIVAVASTYTDAVGSSNNSHIIFYRCQGTLLINGFDHNLQLKYQQFLPANSSYSDIWLKTGYHISNNKLYIVANHKKSSPYGVYGILDVASGKWDKMERLSKKNLGSRSYSAGESILWFDNNFIVPYYSPKMFSPKSDISLQLNAN
ncbi:hypothetical protein [Mucilaginibacter sp. UYNi724]